jgi:hypothetical protein
MASPPKPNPSPTKFLEWSFGTLATLCLGFGFSTLVGRRGASFLISAAVVLYAIVFRFHESNRLHRPIKDLITAAIISAAVVAAATDFTRGVTDPRPAPANSPIQIHAPVTQSAGSCGANVIGNGNTVTNCPQTSDEKREKKK